MEAGKMHDTVVEKILFLMNTELFSDIPTKQLLYLGQISRFHFYAEGECLFVEGDLTPAIYLIVSGSVTVVKNNQAARSYEKGDVLAEMGFFDGSPCVADAISTEETEVLQIDRDEFFDLFRDCVEISHGVLKFYIRRYRYILELISSEGLLQYLVENTDLKESDISGSYKAG